MSEGKEKKKAHVAQYKKEDVKEFERLIAEYPIIAAVNMENMPAPQLQRMRSLLREKVVLRMSKRRMMKIAIESMKDKKKGIEQLIPCMKGMPALIFTKDNPFSLYNTISKNKSPAPAKAGQTAPKDIIVKASVTPFAPGPVIGELGAVGIKTGVEGGKVAIKADSVVVKEGQVIKPNVASILARLGIEPMEIGLDIVAVYEDGMIYKKDVLAIDEEEFKARIAEAGQWAFNLAIEAGILNKDTTEFMIQKAFRDSKAVAIEGNILADAVLGDVLAKAEREMAALKSEANIPDS
ncbi:50S ribosomal protein L10 [Candidatus Woesearchaeota archaeon CG10_big_fil_rev_8_21_14_0_10_44_13]|nr:MAG: 50S ribosomal protein L10 [Candidatus Woesearchaeota archaeon CG10_big_fil_rev_8_21_14_0_10_44_13]